MVDNELNDRLTGAALVSGAASGLGAATARRLAAQGLEVLLFDRDFDAARQAASDIGHRATPYEGDITDEGAVDAAAQAASELHADGLRVSVVCAGIDEAAAILSRRGRLPTEVFERIVRVNLFGTFFQLRAVATQMERNELIAGERGVHISTASVAWSEGTRGTVAYSASKAGVAGMVLAAARDLSRYGIRVCAISPGSFDTPMTDADPPDISQRLIDDTAFPKRRGHPDEYAALVEAICRNRMLNGDVIRLDGGLRLR